MNDGSNVGSALGASACIFGLIGLAVVIFAVLIYWKIFSKAGYNGAMALLMFIPIANLIVLCMLAFGEWPIQRELNYLRQQAGQRPGAFPPSSPQYPSYGQPPYPQQ